MKSFLLSITTGTVLAVGTIAGGSYIVAPLFSEEYGDDVAVATSTSPASDTAAFVVRHLPTPEPLKALYMTSCYASSPKLRSHIVNLATTTEVNAIIIDIKDYTGTISIPSDNLELHTRAKKGCKTLDIREFIGELHDKNIYVIGRVTVFQDPYYTSIHPELAVKKASDGSVWKDYKGLSFIEVGAKPYWDYIVTLAKESYALGFDEINFDYIRFPSDGNMKDIAYPLTTPLMTGHGKNAKAVALEEFFKYLAAQLNGTGIVTSADIFGMTTTNTDDLNIGQVLERAVPYFDYVAPMVYPSHYPKGFNGWANPNHHVYDVIKFSMDKAVMRMNAASTSPLKLRTWIQDFDYGGNYGEKEVRAQIQATYDAGLTSWMVWDPANRYTVSAFQKE